MLPPSCSPSVTSRKIDSRSARTAVSSVSQTPASPSTLVTSPGRSVSTSSAGPSSPVTRRPGGLERRPGGRDVGGDDALRRTGPEQLRDAARRQRPAVAEDRGRRADLLHLGQDVRAEQDRHAGVAQAADHLAHLADAGGVEPVGRLVEDQQRGVLEQRGGDGEPLLHAERVGLVALPVAAGEPDRLDRLVDPRVRDADRPGEQPQVLPAGEVGGELGRLHDRADPAHHLGQGVGHRAAEQRHLAPGGRGQAEQHPDRGGLAGAVGAEEPVHLARAHREVQVGDRHPRAALARRTPCAARGSR